jgi:hypothetical protein
VRRSAALLSTEFAGRRAGVGYSAVVIGTTGVASPASRTISRAKPHHVVSPAAVQ